MATDQFWIDQGSGHITPQDMENPEGWDVWSYLGELVGSRSVVDIGCGRGRLARAFSPEQYLGVDINEKAIQRARHDNPGYEFSVEPRHADVALLYTVLLHISDERLAGFVIDADEIIVAEIMGRKWRRAGKPPVFNRDPEEYIKLFGEPVQQTTHPYKYYGCCDMTIMVFR